MKGNKNYLSLRLYDNNAENGEYWAYRQVEELIDELYPSYDIRNDKDFLEMCEDINKRVPLKAKEEADAVYAITIYKGRFLWAHNILLLRMKLNHEKALIGKEMDHFVTTIKAHSWSYNLDFPTAFKYAEPVDENDTYDIVHVYDNGLKIYDKNSHNLREYISAPNGLMVCYKPELYKQKG